MGINAYYDAEDEGYNIIFNYNFTKIFNNYLEKLNYIMPRK